MNENMHFKKHKRNYHDTLIHITLKMLIFEKIFDHVCSSIGIKLQDILGLLFLSLCV